MKKFFAFVAAALVAFSFTSCEKENTGSNFFKITVSNIEATTADLTIVPSDDEAYYGLAVYYTEDVAKYTVDTLVAYEMTDLIDAVEYGYSLADLVPYNIVFQGKHEHALAQLPANSELTVIAFQVIEKEGTAVVGEVSNKKFKTKDIEVSGQEVDLGVLAGAGFEDYRSDDGSYLAYATDDETYDVTLNIFDADCVGNFTEADMDLEYSYIWTKEMNSESTLAIVKAELESKLAGQDEATISGWVIATDGIKYLFKFTHPTKEGEAEAPAKVRAAKKVAEGLQTVTLKVKHVK